ncbi:hypothetical protein N8I77_008064 [Diaporthe amygdali]|uniref:Uncharacterized protein n=1 Tax=Phomopsis amygdali TaxID=1214568 RepID=A0AAD9SE53_PHOAM|nr:uncharacterized protein J7T55_009524 [Diaporthe amygdali]KAJ0109193.1 hypothetical protein J7T55_009524 [Diaporthe amygdali]KAK2605209.1 hypothetical protein N8I77_008064 [Diaporthe amygdali]
MSDVFRRIGRGGAGNFIPEKEIQEAERAQHAHDPESQKSEATAAPIAEAAAAHPPQYVRVGRGGSGNYTEPPTIAESQDRQDVVERTKAAVSASQAGKPRTGFSSRGGAGNWTEDAPADDSEEVTKQQEIADKVKEDINSSLPPPPKTYHQHDRDME